MEYFTLEQANAALAHVRPLAARMVAHRQAMREAEAEQETLQQRVSGNGGGIPPAELARVAEAVAREGAATAVCIDEIHKLGAVVKDVDSGLVDFPAVRHDEEILLCWQLGEDEIRYWHTLEGGFGGRRPL